MKKQPTFSMAGGLALLSAGILFGVATVIAMGEFRMFIRWDITAPILLGFVFLYASVLNLRRD